MYIAVILSVVSTVFRWIKIDILFQQYLLMRRFCRVKLCEFAERFIKMIYVVIVKIYWYLTFFREYSLIRKLRGANSLAAMQQVQSVTTVDQRAKSCRREILPRSSLTQSKAHRSSCTVTNFISFILRPVSCIRRRFCTSVSAAKLIFLSSAVSDVAMLRQQDDLLLLIES